MAGEVLSFKNKSRTERREKKIYRIDITSTYGIAWYALRTTLPLKFLPRRQVRYMARHKNRASFPLSYSLSPSLPPSLPPSPPPSLSLLPTPLPSSLPSSTPSTLSPSRPSPLVQTHKNKTVTFQSKTPSPSPKAQIEYLQN